MRDKAVVDALDGIRTSIEGLTKELSKVDETSPPKPPWPSDAPTAVYVDASGSVGGALNDDFFYAGFKPSYFEKAQGIINTLTMLGKVDIWSYSGSDSSEGPDGTFTRGLKCKRGATPSSRHIGDHARKHGYTTTIVVTDRLLTDRA